MAAEVKLVGLFSLAVSHGGGSLCGGKTVQEKAELGVNAEVKLEIGSARLMNCLESQFSSQSSQLLKISFGGYITAWVSGFWSPQQ